MIRCLVVDDSRTFRAILRSILEAKPGVSVVGEAADGEEALALTSKLRPDAITMDVRMPRRDGLAAVREIMRVAPTPVVVVSAAGDESHVSFEALRAGAVEVLPKPRGDDPRRFDRDAEAIRQAVRAVAGLRLATRHRRAAAPRPLPVPPPATAAATAPPHRVDVVGIASSTGGPAALERILSALPQDYPLPILLVQHIHAGFEASFVQWLVASTGFDVRVARHGERLSAGTVHVAPADRHLRLSGRRLALDDGPPLRCFRPSGTLLLDSLARELGPAAAGLVLTGMGEDGAAGVHTLLDAGPCA
jgi:two-component system chemotaxis response regulator CheB